MDISYFPPREPILLPYQTHWIKDKSTVKIAEKSRRTGLTWAEASDNVLTASKPRERGGSKVFYIGSRKDMALEYIEACALFAKAYNLLATDIGEEIFADEEGKNEILTFVIRFPKSGFRISALSSRPSNLRGMQGDVVIDEGGVQVDLKGLVTAAMALTMWGSRIRIIGTHNGVNNYFNTLITETRIGKNDYSLHRITLDDALEAGLYKRICYVLRQVWSIEAQQQWKSILINRMPSKELADEEYYCIPCKSSGSVFSRALIEARMNSDYSVIRLEKDNAFNELPELTKDREVLDFCKRELLPLLNKLNKTKNHYLGLDFGRHVDLTVIDSLFIDSNFQRIIPLSVELRNIPFNQQKTILFFIIDRLPRFMFGALDAGGNGMYLAEQARLRYGSGRIAEIKFSETWYLENMPKFKAAFDDASLIIPLDEEQLSDLLALQVIDGIIRLPKGKTNNADKTEKDNKKSRHGDSAISKALAYFASYQKISIIEWEAMPESHYYDGEDKSQKWLDSPLDFLKGIKESFGFQRKSGL